jgi:acyl-CoA reductase-like NAD-dependent aldehyde dehydrogenase
MSSNHEEVSMPVTPLSARIAWAAAFERRIVAREHDLVEAVRVDLGKPAWETVTQDIMGLVTSLRWHRSNAERILAPRRVGGS